MIENASPSPPTKDEFLLVAFLIMLREGIEAALIVGIIAGYLKQTGRQDALPAVWFGVVLALLLCTALGIALEIGGRRISAEDAGDCSRDASRCSRPAFWRRWCSGWPRRRARSSRSFTIPSMPRRDPVMAAGWRWPAMAFLAVGREGLESVFFLIATVQQDVGIGVPIGAALGILCAFAFGVGIVSRRHQAQSCDVLPLDRRVHHFCRGRPAGRRRARLP